MSLAASGSTTPKIGVPPLNLHQINNVNLSIPSLVQTISEEQSPHNIHDSNKATSDELSKENVQPSQITSSRSVFKDRPYLKEKKHKIIGAKDKMALFDLYPPTLTDVDKKLISEDMINFSRPINTHTRFLLKRFPLLRQNPEKDKNVKGGGFMERPPLSPTIRGEQYVHNQQIVTNVVDPSAGLDVLPKSVQAPFSKEFGALNSKLHIPQLPLDTLDMLTTDSFGNSLNSVRVNWVKSEEDLTRSVTLTSRSDAVFTRGSLNRVASAGATRRYNGLKNGAPSSKSLPSTARKKGRNFMEESSNSLNSKLEDTIAETQSLPAKEENEEEYDFSSETEQLIYDSLRTSYYLNLKDEKAKRKGQETITIEEHVRVTNEIIFKVTTAFKEKIKKIQLSMRKEIEKVMKKYSNQLNNAKEDRSDNIVNNFMKDKQIRKQLEKLKEQTAELRTKYDDASNLINEMSVYKERYESMRKEMEKMMNGRPAKSAEQTLSKLMSNDDKMSTKEKQDLMADFIKHFFNEDGSLNEKALFEMFQVNKELHENLSRTRDTVSYLRDQLYEYQKNKAGTQSSPHQKNPFMFFDNSLIKSQQEKQVQQGLSQINAEESVITPNQVDSHLLYELRNRNDYLKKCYEALAQKVAFAERVAFRIKVLHEGVERYTKCVHCKEQTLRPKIFTCGHAFCAKCCGIEKIKKLDNATNSFHYHCTECREVSEELIDNKNLNELLSFANEVENEVEKLEKSIQEALQMSKIEKQKSFKK